METGYLEKLLVHFGINIRTIEVLRNSYVISLGKLEPEQAIKELIFLRIAVQGYYSFSQFADGCFIRNRIGSFFGREVNLLPLAYGK